MEPIRLDCEGCGRTFILGQNALLQTSVGVLREFGALNSAAVIQQATTPNQDDPDLVGPIEEDRMARLFRAFAFQNKQNGESIMQEMSPEELEHTVDVRKKQNVQIYFLAAALKQNTMRWWKCEKCGKVQEYPRKQKQWWQFWK
jgi:hypothetical protein